MKRLFTVAAFAAISLIVVDCSRSPANKGAPPLPVNVVTVVEKEVKEWDEFTGRLDPVESVEIVAAKPQKQHHDDRETNPIRQVVEKFMLQLRMSSII